jgi:hypothetical protein
MKTICFKLISGDELIAKVDSEDDEYLTVEDPVTLSYEYDARNGDYGLKFMSFMPHGDEMVFTFKRKHVITYIEPSEKMIKYYTKYLLASTEQEMDYTFPEHTSREIH